MMAKLTAKWENLINKETGVNVKVNLVGDNKIMVRSTGDMFPDVFNFFISFRKHIEIQEDGYLITLD